MNLNSVYTPQMIVNGQLEFVGSSKGEAEKAIDEGLKQLPSFQISILDAKLSDDEVHVKYSVDKTPNGEFLNVVVVERDAENFVPRGENSGKTLHHDNVVRAFKTTILQRTGELVLKISTVNSAKSSLVFYVQDKQWHVVGVTTSPL